MGQVFLAKGLAGTTELSSRPERTRISYFAMLATTMYAALLKESRTEYINATVLDGKSGERSGGTCGTFPPVLTHPL
jgi:hypothetical protein